MAITITALDVTEGYASLTVLTQAQLNLAVNDTETYCNTQLRYNLMQLAKDTMDNATYTFNDDGDASLATPLWDLCAQLADNETVTGQWIFSDSATFNSTMVGGASHIATSAGQPRVKAYMNAADQVIPDITATALAFTAETYDVGALHSNALNTSRITVVAANVGVYIFNAQAVFAADATGLRTLMIYKNNAKICEVKEFNPEAAEETTLNVSFQDECITDDYYEAFVYQSSGGNLSVMQTVSFFSAIKVW